MPANDRIRPPKAGQEISTRYLHQQHRRADRHTIIATPPLYARETPGGTVLGLRLAGLLLGWTTSTITAATYSGAAITAFGGGTCTLYELSLDGPGGDKQAAPNADKPIDVLSVGTSTIASGTTVLLGVLFGEAAGYVVLGKVC